MTKLDLVNSTNEKIVIKPGDSIRLIGNYSEIRGLVKRRKIIRVTEIR